MNTIPKKLNPCTRTKSFIQDEKNEDVLLIYGSDINSVSFRSELVKRYNIHELLIAALTFSVSVSLGLILYIILY